jgi:hypothetical protein
MNHVGGLQSVAVCVPIKFSLGYSFRIAIVSQKPSPCSDAKSPVAWLPGRVIDWKKWPKKYNQGGRLIYQLEAGKAAAMISSNEPVVNQPRL